MDAYGSLHPLPAQWLRDSALAQFVPAYWRRLIERQYAPNTARVYLCAVAHFALWSRSRQLDFGCLDQDEECFVEELGIPGDRDRSFRRIVTDDSGLS